MFACLVLKELAICIFLLFSGWVFEVAKTRLADSPRSSIAAGRRAWDADHRAEWPEPGEDFGPWRA